MVRLTANDNRIDLRGLITLQNASGTAYRDASVQLVAGDVNVVRSSFQNPARALQQSGAVRAASVAQQELFEYHLYTLPRHTTIVDNQTKQVEMLSAPGVAVTKTLDMTRPSRGSSALSGTSRVRVKDSGRSIALRLISRDLFTLSHGSDFVFEPG